MNDLLLCPRFPATSFGSFNEFQSFQKERQDRLDTLYSFERQLASRDEFVIREGVCAPCLRPTSFRSPTQGGEVCEDGRMIPHWRESQTCECGDSLPHIPRAMLHLMQSKGLLQPWTRHLIFGSDQRLSSRLRTISDSVTEIARLALAPKRGGDSERGATHTLNVPSENFHSIVSIDYLNYVPPLAVALRLLRAALQDGGLLIFAVPFRALEQYTVSHIDLSALSHGQQTCEVDFVAHDIGWDILDHLLDAGFYDAQAHLIWSDTLGYLGPLQFIFTACA